ncbi:dUTP diphosphatase [bacterium]|nr:dUTP diphosphatase [bacterium]
MHEITVNVTRVPGSEDLPLPAYQSDGAAGLDLTAAVTGDTVIEPGATMLIPTGLKIAIPSGYEGQVRPRSGLALRHGLGVLNAPGTIDSDYRGEVGVIVFNVGAEPFTVRRGDRIAQLVVTRYERVTLRLTDTLDESGRGEGGFGSTGRT